MKTTETLRLSRLIGSSNGNCTSSVKPRHYFWYVVENPVELARLIKVVMACWQARTVFSDVFQKFFLSKVFPSRFLVTTGLIRSATGLLSICQPFLSLWVCVSVHTGFGVPACLGYRVAARDIYATTCLMSAITPAAQLSCQLFCQPFVVHTGLPWTTTTATLRSKGDLSCYTSSWYLPS